MNTSITREDLTPKRLFSLTTPQLGLMLCHLCVSMTDIWAAGKISGESQAAIGIVSQIFAFMVLMASVAGSGALTAVSQALGAKKRLKAKRYAALVVSLAFAAGTVIAAVFMALRPAIPHIFSVDENAAAPLAVFSAAYMAQLPFFYTLIIMNTVFRAYTFVKIPLITTVIVASCNIAGDMLFGLGYMGFPNMGYAGIAWSTFFSALAGFIFNVFMIRRTGIIERESFASVRWIKAALPYLFRVSVPSAAGQFVSVTGSLAVLWLLTRIPGNDTASVAGMTLGMRIETAILFPIAAFAVTMSIISGHLLGAGQKSLLYSFGKKAAAAVTLFTVVFSALIFIFRQHITFFFTSDAETALQASIYLVFACAALPLKGCASIAASAFAGTGATGLSMKITAVSSWLIQIPLALALTSALKLGPAGIFAASAAASAVSALMYLAEYRRKSWMEYGMNAGAKNARVRR